MRKTFFNLLTFSFLAGTSVLCGNVNGQVKILFDASKAEMAGNADWVIDHDHSNIKFSGTSGLAYTTTPDTNQSNPQQIPTPPQSGITAATPGTYWDGGISSWAVDCAKKGYIVESLPWNGQITYGNTSNAQDLSNYKVYVVDEPNIRFSSSEKTALMQFVQNGGGLFIIADHEGSDRNNEGYDSRMIWNDFFQTNGVAVNPFGMYFDSVDFSQTTTNISAAATDSIIHGPMGNVTKAQWAGGTTMTLDPSKNATVKGVIFKTGTTPGNTNAMVAYARYGSGKVAAMGDSSPADDGTGNPTCTLYDGYIADASGNHQLLIMNMTIWLADTVIVSHVGVQEVATASPVITIAPNPAKGAFSIGASGTLNNTVITVTNLAGVVVAQKNVRELNKDEHITFNVEPGFYMVKTEGDNVKQILKVVVY